MNVTSYANNLISLPYNFSINSSLFAVLKRVKKYKMKKSKITVGLVTSIASYFYCELERKGGTCSRGNTNE